MSTIWILVDRLRGWIAIAALAAPFVGLAIGVLIAGGRRAANATRSSWRATWLSAALGALMTPVLLYVAMCTPPPGEGVAARAGFARAAIVVAALDEFRARRGVPPDTLSQLVPTFLADSTLMTRDKHGKAGYPFTYRSDGTGFVLSFRYVGPGMNECDFASKGRSWRCGGYF